MKMQGNIHWGSWIFILVASVSVIAIAIGGFRYYQQQRACASFGYPGSNISASTFGRAYCVRRLDQTDEVVPLSDLQSGKVKR